MQNALQSVQNSNENNQKTPSPEQIPPVSSMIYNSFSELAK